ncbi:MAG TPA: zinc ribbon domain-containing protein [Ktedonobacterales bacterium]|nr:zinc ribbon domain-containing protein [Ktedonobacterales bacterium]
MQDFLENAKRKASAAMDRAAWEADKLRRGSARQKEVDLAQRERVTLLEQMAQMVLEMDKQGTLTDQRLRALADRMRSLDGEIARGQADVQTIKNEPYGQQANGASASTSAPRQVASITELCSTCGQPIRAGAVYCPGCGARQR